MKKIVAVMVLLTVLVLGRRFLPVDRGEKPGGGSAAPGARPAAATVAPGPPPSEGAPGITVAAVEALKARLAEAESKIEAQSKRVALLFVLNQMVQLDVRSRHGEFDLPDGIIGRAGELKARPQGLPRHVGLRLVVSGKTSGPLALLPVLLERLALFRLHREVTALSAPVRIWREELGDLKPSPARADLKVGSVMLDSSLQGEVQLGADRVRLDITAYGVADGQETYRVHEEGLVLEEVVAEAMRQVARREVQAAKGR